MTYWRKDCQGETMRGYPLQKTLQKPGRRMAALCLIGCLLASCLTGCGLFESDQTPARSSSSRSESRSNVVDGHWIEADDQEEFFDYLYVLDRPVERCESFWVNYSVDIASDNKCNDWDFYVRSDGEWYEAASFYMPSGRITQQVFLSSPMTVDAVTTYPDCDGDLSWDDVLEIYDVSQASHVDTNDIEANDVPVDDILEDILEDLPDDVPEEVRPSSGWLSGSWSADTYHINNANVSAWVLDTPIYNCEQLKVGVNVEMLHNTSCTDWKVYTWTGSFWKQIGSLYLPGGNGEGEVDIRLDQPMTISHVAVVPKVVGTYSWSLGVGVQDMS